MRRTLQSEPTTGSRRKIVVAIDLHALTGEVYTTKGSPRLPFDDIMGLIRAVLTHCALPADDVSGRCDGTCAWRRLVERPECGHLGIECAGCRTAWCLCEPWRPAVDVSGQPMTEVLDVLSPAGE